MASTQRKQQEEGPLSWAADRNLPTILHHLQWPEDPELHAPTLPP
jgi:hypothetical protein